MIHNEQIIAWRIYDTVFGFEFDSFARLCVMLKVCAQITTNVLCLGEIAKGTYQQTNSLALNTIRNTVRHTVQVRGIAADQIELGVCIECNAKNRKDTKPETIWKSARKHLRLKVSNALFSKYQFQNRKCVIYCRFGYG